MNISFVFLSIVTLFYCGVQKFLLTCRNISVYPNWYHFKAYILKSAIDTSFCLK